MIANAYIKIGSNSYEKVKTFKYLGSLCRPRWSRGTVPASRLKVRRTNPAEVDGFFQDLKLLSTSPPGGTLSWGSRV